METEKTGYERALELIEECVKTKNIELQLDNLNLKSIPKEVNQCIWVKNLSLARNKIKHLDNFDKLTNLEILTLRNNRIENIDKLVFHKNLRHIFLSRNNIKNIDKLKKLPYLKNIYFYNNKIEKITLDIYSILVRYQLSAKLIYEMKYDAITEQKYERAADLRDFESTLIKHEEDPEKYNYFSIKLHEKFIWDSIQKNPINFPPLEILKQGSSSVLNFYQQLNSQGIDLLYEAKTLIIGKAGAGKTSLRYKLKDQKCQLPKDNESTKGIDIDPMTFPVPKENRDFNVNIWDFGGQEIYHNTHQFFLTKRSLYVLVADYRTEKHEINYWMQIVEMMGGGSPLLIVQNEKDNRIGDLNLAGLKSQYNEIYKDDFRIDLRAIADGEYHKADSEKAFNQLQTEIQSKLLQLPHIGDALPKQWVVIRKEIEKLAAEKPHISEDDFYDLCAEHEITDNQKQRDLSQYFHDLGVFLHFQNENKPTSLSEIVILQNTWATEAVYKVLDSTLVKDEQFGRFTYKDLKQIWQDSKWRSKAKELLELMMEFKLCYEIADTAEYIAPQLLPAEQPAYPWDKTSNLQLRYRYGFMPKGIITRFIVKMHKYIAEGQTLVWKEGVILEYKDAKAEVIETYRDNEIHIRVSGSQGKELLTIIAHNIDELNGAFEKIRVDKLVPCNCSECKSLTEPHFYKYQNLIRRKAKGKRTVECEISYDDVNVLKLIEDVLIANFAGKEEIRQLIRKPDLKRAIRLLDGMVELDSPEANELAVIESNFNDLMQRYYQNLLSEENYKQERAKTANALLSFLDHI